MGIFDSLADVFLVLPMRYEDRRTIHRVTDFADGETVFVDARVEKVERRTTGSGRRLTSVYCTDRSGDYFQCTFFQFPPYLQAIITAGRRWVFLGKAKKFGQTWTLAQPLLRSPEEVGSIIPIYRKQGKHGSEAIRKALLDVHRFVPAMAFDSEFPPDDLAALQQLGLPGVREAFRKLHRPEEIDDVTEAQETFRTLEALRLLRGDAEGPTVTCDARTASEPWKLPNAQKAKLLGALPFTLTESQSNAWHDLLALLESGKILQGLLLGGVGSGKSVIAYLLAAAHWFATTKNRNVILVAPTTILADQLAEGMGKIATVLGIPVHRVDTAKAGRKSWQLPVGISVGTLGLLQKIERSQSWDSVGMVILDEEHRFGKEQKAVPPSVHQLLMSATPIPATLARVCFRRLSIFSLEGRPRDVVTQVVPRKDGAQALTAVADTIEKGGKVMVVYGSIECTPLPETIGPCCITSPKLGTDLVVSLTESTATKDALATALCVSSGARRRMLRLVPGMDVKAEVQRELRDRGVFAYPLYAYDKEQPDRIFLLSEKDTGQGKDLRTVNTLLAWCRNGAVESLPLYRESELIEGKDLQTAAGIWEKQFPGKVVTLTGRVSNEEKQDALRQFMSGDRPLLVSTTIVEVGVDVEGTDLMIIANAERLGIASLVQLRGRVGRHGQQGKCLLVGPDDPEKLERLEAFAAETSDEKLATMDFFERGFGMLRGTQQSGNVGSLFRLPRDKELFERILRVI